jgi:hypothetical protein
VVEPVRPGEHQREFLLCNGGLRRVVTVEDELVPWEEWQRRELERSVRRCACGQVCAAGSARTCGSRECIDRLTADAASR